MFSWFRNGWDRLRGRAPSLGADAPRSPLDSLSGPAPRPGQPFESSDSREHRQLPDPHPPPQGNFRTGRTFAGAEYVSAGANLYLGQYLRVLPQYIDQLTQDFGDDLYDRMLLDPEVYASVTAFILGVLSEGVQVRPAITKKADEGYAISREIADFTERCLGELRRTIDETLEEMMLCTMLGNRIGEQLYEPVESGPDAGKMALREIKIKPRKSTAFVVDAFNNTIGLRAIVPGVQTFTGVGITVLDPAALLNVLPRKKFAILAWRTRDGDPRGTSIGRSAYEPWWDKRQATAEYLKYLIQFAAPSIYGILGPDAIDAMAMDSDANLTGAVNDSPINKLLYQLLQWRNGTALALPNGTQIGTLFAATGGEAFLNGLERFDRQINKAILLATRTTTESRFGSKADSETAQDVTGTQVRFVRRWVGERLSLDICKPLTLYNYGEIAASRYAPTLSLSPVEHQDATQLSVYVTAYTAGVIKPSQLPWLWEHFGIPMASDEDMQGPATGGAGAPPQPPARQSGGGGGSPRERILQALQSGGGEAGFAAPDWQEQKHPRGQPGNPGQFGPGGGGAPPAAPSAPAAAPSPAAPSAPATPAATGGPLGQHLTSKKPVPVQRLLKASGLDETTFWQELGKLEQEGHVEAVTVKGATAYRLTGKKPLPATAPLAPPAKPAATAPPAKSPAPPAPAPPAPVAPPPAASAAPPAAHLTALARGFAAAPDARYNLVGFDELHRALPDLSIPDLHRAILHLQKQGILSLSGLEGREGITEEQSRTRIPADDPREHDLGHASVRDPQRFAALLQGSASFAFHPDEPRDQAGRWTGRGGTAPEDHAHARHGAVIRLREAVSRAIQAGLAHPGNAVRRTLAAARAVRTAYRQGGAGAVSRLAVKSATRKALDGFRRAEERYGRPAAVAMAGAYLGCYAAYALSPSLMLFVPSPTAAVVGVAESIRLLLKGGKKVKQLAGFSAADLVDMDAMLDDLWGIIRDTASAAGEETPRFRADDLRWHLGNLLGRQGGGQAPFAVWDESKHPRGQPGNPGEFGPGGGGAVQAAPKAPRTYPDAEVTSYRGRGDHLTSWNFNGDDGEPHEQDVYIQEGEAEDEDGDTVEVYRWISVDDDSGTQTDHGDWTADRDQAEREGEDFAESSNQEPEEPEEDEEDEDEDDEEEDEDEDSIDSARVRFADPGYAYAIRDMASDFFDSDDLNIIPDLVGAPAGSMTTLSMSMDGEELWVRVDHPDFEQPCKRRFGRDEEGELYCYNDLIDIKESKRGSGLGSAIFSQQVQQCRSAGVSYIQCHAARLNSSDEPYFNGYYTWPRMGYDADLDDIAIDLEEDSIDAQRLQKIREAFPAAESVLEVMSTPEGRQMWKDYGVGIKDARFDLASGSPSLLIHEAYRASKKGQ